MKDGQTKRYLGADQLRRIIGSAMRLTDEGEQDNIWGIIRVAFFVALFFAKVTVKLTLTKNCILKDTQVVSFFLF